MEVRRREEAREIAKEKAHKGDTNCGVPCSTIGAEEEEYEFIKRGEGGGEKHGGGAGMMSHECWISGRRGSKEVMEWDEDDGKRGRENETGNRPENQHPSFSLISSFYLLLSFSSTLSSPYISWLSS